MSLTVNAKAYVADGFQADSVHYQGPNKTQTVVDDLILKRYPVKGASATRSGKAGYMVKANRTHTLTGALSTVEIGGMRIDFDLPVGISDADRDAYCNDYGAFIASAAFKAMLKALQVNG